MVFASCFRKLHSACRTGATPPRFPRPAPWARKASAAGGPERRHAGRAVGLACGIAVAIALVGCDDTRSMSHADARRGARLMAQYQCGSCHTVPGVAAAQGKFAITLESFGRRSYIAGRIPNRDPALVRWIVDPPSLVPDTRMPSMGVSEADARDIAAYLRSLR